MAWIESHQDLREHPKVYALMDKLKIPKAQVIGHLHLLWWWCIDYAEDGHIRYGNDQIARAAQYEGEANAFVESLISVRWIDSENGALNVHDWFDFCGPLIEKRLERRNLKERRKADAKKSRTDSKNVRAVAERTPTVPYQTVPNQPDQQLKPPAQAFGPKELLILWNHLAPSSLARAKDLNNSRRASIQARLKDHPDKGFWVNVMCKIRESPLLRGEVPRRDGPPWKATFDWIINPTNLTKIVEGNYDEDRRRTKVPAGIDRILDREVQGEHGKSPVGEVPGMFGGVDKT